MATFLKPPRISAIAIIAGKCLGAAVFPTVTTSAQKGAADAYT